MSAGCCNSSCAAPADAPPGWRRALWIALAANAAMFVVEIAAGIAAGSTSLQADAIDFLGDAANYGVSLAVAGMALAWRARAALLKGATMGLFGLWVIASATWHAWAGTVPSAQVMGVVGVAALIVNVGVAVMLFRFRNGESNMRSVWVCSRNDAFANIAVLAAAAGVAGTGTGWPDLAVAAAMAVLALQGAWVVIRQAVAELRPATGIPAAAE